MVKVADVKQTATDVVVKNPEPIKVIVPPGEAADEVPEVITGA